MKRILSYCVCQLSLEAPHPASLDKGGRLPEEVTILNLVVEMLNVTQFKKQGGRRKKDL